MHHKEEQELEASLQFMRKQFQSLTDGIPIPGSLQADLLKKQLEQMEAEQEEEESEVPQGKPPLRFPTRALVGMAACLAVASVAMLSYHMGKLSGDEQIIAPAVEAPVAAAAQAPLPGDFPVAPLEDTQESAATDTALADSESTDVQEPLPETMFSAPIPPEGKIRALPQTSVSEVGAPALVADAPVADIWAAYLPKSLPNGLVTATCIQDGDSLTMSYLNEDYSSQIQLTLRTFHQELSSKVVEPDQPETYDLRMYEAPYADTVPQGLSVTVNDPMFRWEDLTEDIVASRVFDPNGEPGQEQGNFSVLFPTGMVAELNITGLSAAQIYDLLKGMYSQ